MKPVKFLILQLLFISTLSIGQTFQDVADLNDKSFSKAIRKDSPLGKEMKMLVRQGKITKENLTLPKRIGLLSFYIYDESWGKKQGNYIVWNFLTEKGANKFAQQFHDEGISAINTALKTESIELLTPEQFLNTSEKKEIYKNFEVQYTGLLKAAAGFAGAFASGAGKRSISATPYGYRLFAVTGPVGQDPKLQRTMGKLAKDLELDAVMVLQISTVTNAKNSAVKDIQLSMFGPNPEEFDPDRKYPGIMGAGGYWEGKCYGWYSLLIGDIVFVKHSKKKGGRPEETFQGWDQLLARLGKHFIGYINEVLTYPK